ncbi:hypothetical protein LEP3755_66710 (plasmid) [Leptolyngbya sp. NIES-3755]|nr:hypothetical protein LEP3755_66710 [Leptolyngbya sp. NIES-3755]
MTTSLNTMLALYRHIQQQRYVLINLQLEELSESITQTLDEIAQQERKWLKIEGMTLGSFQFSLNQDARILLETKDFQTFLEQLADERHSDFAPSAIAALATEPGQWQLSALATPLQIKRFHIAIDRRICRMQVKLGAWQQHLELAIFMMDFPVNQGYSDPTWHLNLLEQLENADFGLDETQQVQVQHELSLLLAYLVPLLCICPITPEFVYPQR